MKFADIVGLINSAPSGSFVGITDYVSEKADVTSVTGHLGVSYAKAKEKKIEALEKAIQENDFSPITVEGDCHFDETKNVFNSRKKSAPIRHFKITYGRDQVLQTMQEILESWKNPKERANNKVNLSEKENGLTYNTETGTFTFSLLVEKIYYKEEASEKAKEESGLSDKVTIKQPETLLKEAIRKRFEKPFRTYTLEEGKFKNISIGGTKFSSDEITF